MRYQARLAPIVALLLPLGAGAAPTTRPALRRRNHGNERFAFGAAI